MGAALEKLGEMACERIAAELLDMTHKNSGARLGVHCPWHEERSPGACWYDPTKDKAICYSCGNSGDIIDVFCAVQGMDAQSPASFRAFFEKYATSAVLSRSGRDEKKRQRPTGWTPRADKPEADNMTWQEGATAFVLRCADAMQGEHFERLMLWGVNPETAKNCCIGYCAKDNFIPFTRWGLPYAENSKGRERHIHLPQGFVFPVFGADGALLRVKVRLDNPRDEKEKYKAVVGGANCYGIWGDRKSRVWFVTETERDGMLLWQELGAFGIGAMATGSASLPPDAVSHGILSRADCIINALDNDHAGATASWGFDPDAPHFRWNTAYAHARRWLVPSSVGKDPADLVGKVNIVDWALAALPVHVRERCQIVYAQDGDASPVAF